jgi:hypothetical protein
MIRGAQSGGAEALPHIGRHSRERIFTQSRQWVDTFKCSRLDDTRLQAREIPPTAPWGGILTFCAKQMSDTLFSLSMSLG